MTFINTMPYISSPVERYAGFTYRPWASILPRFKGAPKAHETSFVADLAAKGGATRLIDLSQTAGLALRPIIETLLARGNPIGTAAVGADGAQDSLSPLSREHYPSKTYQDSLHEWASRAPKVQEMYDFALLTGNALTHIARAETQRELSRIVEQSASIVTPGGRLSIDIRDFDFMSSLRGVGIAEIARRFCGLESVYYHGSGQETVAFPAHISDAHVVLHFYDLCAHEWSANDLYPLRHAELLQLLAPWFDVTAVFRDCRRCNDPTVGEGLFIQ
jgi:hypothetical protein